MYSNFSDHKIKYHPIFRLYFKDQHLSQFLTVQDPFPKILLVCTTKLQLLAVQEHFTMLNCCEETFSACLDYSVLPAYGFV